VPSRQNICRVSETTPAILLPYEQTDLFAKLTGYVSKINVDYGDRVHGPRCDSSGSPVKPGDVLVELWVPEMVAAVRLKREQVEQARKALAMADAQVLTAKAQLREAEAGVSRAQANQSYWKSQSARVAGLVKDSVLDKQTQEETQFQFRSAVAALGEVEAKVESAKAALQEKGSARDKAEADIRAAEADRDQTEDMLQYAKILAPYDGVVTKRSLHTGALVSAKPGDQPLLSIARTDLLRVVVEVSERDVRYLSKEAKVTAEFDGLPGRRFEWRVTRMAPVLGAGKRVRVEVEVPNPDGSFYAGMYGRASVILEERREVMTVPASSLGNDSQGAFVWLVDGGKAARRRVTVGITDGSNAEITSGLKGSEELISQGIDSLAEGQPLVAQKSDAGKRR
jgi:multidrug efflux pump subunit AcrA (membrane-fusion protein)